jgi:hypothetical protein
MSSAVSAVFPQATRRFPNLNLETAAKKSEPTPDYNCIAFAVGDETQCWWPNEDGYWPEGVAGAETVDAFVAAFGTREYAKCDLGELEPDFEKIAFRGRAAAESPAPDGRIARHELPCAAANAMEFGKAS